jgi:transposase
MRPGQQRASWTSSTTTGLELLPLELWFGSGQTCRRRLERWQQAGVFDQLHRSSARSQSGWPCKPLQFWYRDPTQPFRAHRKPVATGGGR